MSSSVLPNMGSRINTVCIGPIYFMRIKFCEFCILSNIIKYHKKGHGTGDKHV